MEIFVEVRDRNAYLFSSVLPGPGGMPLGSQGRVLSSVDSEIGLASTWLMMKRGCSALVATRSESLLEPLRKWYPHLKIVEPEDNLFTLARGNGCIGIAFAWRLDDIEKASAPIVGPDGEELPKKKTTHLERAQQYKKENSCSITDALKATADKR